jgi:uncharacterized protein (DUF1330 family)
MMEEFARDPVGRALECGAVIIDGDMASVDQQDEETNMVAYVVFIRNSTQNPAELQLYWSMVKATLADQPVRVLAAYGEHEVLEGPAIEGAVIAEFPTIEAAKAWYLGSAYQAAAAHRLKGASYVGFIVEGVKEPGT